ncbi:MAG: hypothetical protein KKE61_23915 [Proteobacteria bacterium]|nr:hypothetical protein [Pseudomonadota bacterium]
MGTISELIKYKSPWIFASKIELENPCSVKADDKSATPAGGSHGLATGGKINNMLGHPKTNENLNHTYYHI